MFALAVSGSEKVRQIAPKDLAYFVLGILALVVVGIVIKRVVKMNGIVMFLIVAAALFVVGITWIYQRTEPRFLTPLVDHIAPFLPSAPTPYSQRPGATPGTTPAAAPVPQKPAAPPAQQKPTPPAQQKPAPGVPSKVY